jgi:hypothetical protein
MDPEIYAEYRAGMDSLGQTEWVALKKNLCGNNSLEVLALFKRFVTAWLERQRADEELEEFTGYTGPDTRLLMETYAEQTRLLNEARYAMRTQKLTYYDLQVAVYGKENVPMAPEYSDDDDNDGSGDYSD